MKYDYILKAISDTIWAIHPPKLEEIIGVVQAREAGLTLDADYLAAINERRRANLGTRGGVAVLGLHGTISHRPSAFSSGGTSAEEFGREFDAAVASDEVERIVLDVDSPGGSVMGIEETAAKIRGARGKKPITTVVNASMHSAAFWIGSAADETVITPSGMMGSHGVIATHVDRSRANDAEGYVVTYITAGKYKAEGNADEPLGDEARAELQRHVDRYYRAFTHGLAANRGVSAAEVQEKFGQGRVFGATDAVERGMADRIATLEDVVAEGRASVTRRHRANLMRRKVAAMSY